MCCGIKVIKKKDLNYEYFHSLIYYCQDDKDIYNSLYLNIYISTC